MHSIPVERIIEFENLPVNVIETLVLDSRTQAVIWRRPGLSTRVLD